MNTQPSPATGLPNFSAEKRAFAASSRLALLFFSFQNNGDDHD